MQGTPAWLNLLALLVALTGGISGGLSLAYSDRRSRRSQPPRLHTPAGVVTAGRTGVSMPSTSPQSLMWGRANRLANGVWLFYDGGAQGVYLRVTKVGAAEFAVERVSDAAFLARSTTQPLSVEVLTVTRGTETVIVRLVTVPVQLTAGDLVVDSAVVARDDQAGQPISAGQLTAIELRTFARQLEGAKPLGD